MYSPLRGFSDGEGEKLSEILDWIYADFTTKVGERRRLNAKEVDAVARGRVWTGKDAKSLGLVDVLGGYEEAILLARQSAGLDAEEPALITVYPRRKGRLEGLYAALREADIGGILGGIRDLALVLGYAEAILDIVPELAEPERASLRTPPISIR